MNIDQVMQAWRGTKCNVATDLEPQLDVELVDGSRHMAVVPDRDYIVPTVERVCREAGDLPVLAVAFMADAFIREIPAEDAAGYERGDISRAFGRGDKAVSEVLIVTVIDRDGLHLVQQPYASTSTGIPMFKSARVTRAHGDGVQGAAADELRRAMMRFG